MARASRILKPLAALAAIGAAAASYPYIFPGRSLEVEVFRAARGDVRESVSSPTSGTLVSGNEAVVASQVVGRVRAVLLKAGDRVAEGAPVVLLDDEEAAVDVRAAEAALSTRRAALGLAEVRARKAQEDLAPWEVEGRRKLIADEQFRTTRASRDLALADQEGARSAVREAEVALDRARIELSKRRIVAPFAGVIRNKPIEPGESVGIGTPCFEVYDDTRLLVRAPLDEVDIPRVKPGLPVEVTLEPFGDRIFRGVLRDIEPGVRAQKELNRTGQVEVDLVESPTPTADGSYPPGEGPLRVGMSADVEVITRTHANVLRVPAYTLHEDNALADNEAAREVSSDRSDVDHFVYVVDTGKIARRKVGVGISNWDYVEITTGLTAGEPVVVSLDLKDLAPGKPATIVREVRRVTGER